MRKNLLFTQWEKTYYLQLEKTYYSHNEKFPHHSKKKLSGHENFVAVKPTAEDLEILIASVLQVPTGNSYRGLFTSSKAKIEKINNK